MLEMLSLLANFLCQRFPVSTMVHQSPVNTCWLLFFMAGDWWTQPHILVDLDASFTQKTASHSYQHSGKDLKFGPLKRPFCSSGTVGITIRFQSNPREDEVPRNFTFMKHVKTRLFTKWVWAYVRLYVKMLVDSVNGWFNWWVQCSKLRDWMC